MDVLRHACLRAPSCMARRPMLNLRLFRTNHQKPTAGGLTTATVVGPADEEIFTDENGRIKIQFHWQRTQDHPGGGADLEASLSDNLRIRDIF